MLAGQCAMPAKSQGIAVGIIAVEAVMLAVVLSQQRQHMQRMGAGKPPKINPLVETVLRPRLDIKIVYDSQNRRYNRKAETGSWETEDHSFVFDWQTLLACAGPIYYQPTTPGRG